MENKNFSYIFVWHSCLDERSCKKCVALHGRIYRDQDLFAPVLVDPEFGFVWDLDNNRSLAHGTSHTCRCGLEVTVESVDIDNLVGFKEFWQMTERVT